MDNKSVAVFGGASHGWGSRLGAVLSAMALAGGSGIPTLQPHRTARHRLAPTRSTWKRTGGRKAGYPGQTPEQKAYALEQAQAKRNRRAISCTEYAKRSAEGYHPWSQLQGLRATVAELNAKLD